MKFLVSKANAINLANVSEITISCNYLKLTTTGGLNSREIQFVYGTDAELHCLFDAVMDFVANNTECVFDCDNFISALRFVTSSEEI